MFAQAPAPAPHAQDDRAQRIDAYLRSVYPAHEPGAAVLVEDGQVVLRKGYGMAHLELGVPIQPDMVFGIGSITKQFTAAAILLLQERGKLSVDDEVTKYLPDYPTHGQKITIDHLLTHVSGIPSYTGLPEWLPRVREDMTVQQLIDLFKDKPLEFTPGEKWAYNNSAYILLGAVIEKVSGKSYEDFIEQEIFAPLGHEAHPLRAQTRDHPAAGWRAMTRRTDGYERRVPQHDPAVCRGLPDVHGRRPGALGRGAAGGKLLKKESLERMTTPAKLNAAGPPTTATAGGRRGRGADRRARRRHLRIRHRPAPRARPAPLIVVLSNNPARAGPGTWHTASR